MFEDYKYEYILSILSKFLNLLLMIQSENIKYYVLSENLTWENFAMI